MEWGSFWSSHLPRTSYDIALDDESPNQNDQAGIRYQATCNLIELVQ